MNTWEFLHRTVLRFPDNRALWYKGQYMTYFELENRVVEFAGRLLTLGLQKEDRVALLAEPTPETIVALLAIQAIGGIAVLINGGLTPEDYLTLVDDVKATHLLLGHSYKSEAFFARQLSEMPLPDCIQCVVCIGRHTYHFPRLTALKSAGRSSVLSAAAATKPEDTAMIIFTSGSTGHPKAVCSSHFSRVNSGIQQAHDFLTTEKDRFCVAMPSFHCFCISANIMAALSAGACLCLPENRHTSTLIDTVQQCGCTILHSVPTMFHALLAKTDPSETMSTVRTGIIGGAGCSPEDFARIDAAFGPQFTLMSSLGQTECTAGFTVCNPDDTLEVRANTLGHFMAHVEGKIADTATGAPLPAGEIGEICMRGYLAMQKYYGNEAETRKTLDEEGWIHTGDLGSLDENGNLTIRGRIKELIIRGGENISPLEVENALRRVVELEECKVVGVPDSHYGEELCACIAMPEGKTADPNAIRANLKKYLADYKVPRYIEFFHELPKTGTGKISGKDCLAVSKVRLAGRNCGF